MKSTTERKRRLAIAVVLALSITAGFTPTGFAADTTVGGGNGVAYGTGSNAPKAENVAIGNGAKIHYSNGASTSTGDVAIGNGADIDNYSSQGGSIAMGSSAKVENTTGLSDAAFAFGQTTFTGSLFNSVRIPADPSKVTGSIAIGQNSFARSGSTMIGTHNYSGDLGDTTITSTRANNLGLYTTTIGSNSYANGFFSTLSGSYSIISGDYNGGTFSNAAKNVGATVTGSLNSVESMTGGRYSGVANTVTGFANRTNNSNGSLIYGAGNTITNSYTDLSNMPTSSGDSGKAFQDTLITAVKASNSGGSTMAFGGGNTADYTQLTSMIGVNNTITGTNGNEATLNSVMGYNNTVTNASNNIIMGNDRTVTAANTVALGGLSSAETRSVANTTSVGYDTNVTVADGVALGYQSVASVDKGAVGYDLAVNGASSETNSTWQATSAAVSVGDVDNGVTRQITSVAAGTNDTDAVNVAQLKKAVASTGGNVKVEGATPNVSVEADTTSEEGTTTYKISVAASESSLAFKGDSGTEFVPSDSVTIKGGATGDLTENNIGVVSDADAKTLNVQLAKDIKGLDSIETKTITADTVTATTVAANTVTANTVTANTVNVGDTAITTNGITTNQVSVTNGPTINSTGIDMGGTTVTNLNDGTVSADSTDAVTGRQLFNTTQQIDKVNNRVNKVGAGAAALAALHPLDFDPDDKWNFAAGYGNYKGENAVAVGAFYRPNEDTMFSVAGSMGNGENMVNAGVSLKFGQKSGVTNSRVAVAKEVKDLKAAVAVILKENQELKSAVRELAAGRPKNVEFSDLPKDHWAYRYVTELAEQGVIEGYPDGTFRGDRPISRYEFAAIVYRALQNGAPIDGNMGRALSEFKPELDQLAGLDHFRVDRVAGSDNDRHKIERVRVNSKNNKAEGIYKDVYGSNVEAPATDSQANN